MIFSLSAAAAVNFNAVAWWAKWELTWHNKKDVVDLEDIMK